MKVVEIIHKQVVIDRGIFKIGISFASVEEQEPHWESTLEGRSLVIGHEDEVFDISSVDDIEFLLTQVSNRLKLDFIAKLTPIDLDKGRYRCSRCKEDMEISTPPEFIKFCCKCGAIFEKEKLEEAY